MVIVHTLKDKNIRRNLRHDICKGGNLGIVTQDIAQQQPGAVTLKRGIHGGDAKGFCNERCCRQNKRKKSGN